ncbi:lipase-3 domain-containing protein [Favolaschia claudopus]|uniref:Lipase-3 domain-containing protein n=1 Tax=Favolaschia claudopus TaxID=2862362 RepID=A0AAV9ZLE3_9AGAR
MYTFVPWVLSALSIATSVVASPLAVPVANSTSPVIDVVTGITSALFDDFILYTKYCSASYRENCARPVGRALFNEPGHITGFIARDDGRLEIVVTFRGTHSVDDALTVGQLALTPFISRGINETFSVHTGFLNSYNGVADDVIRIVKEQLVAHPGYRIIVTGHSLGGGVAAIAAPSLRVALGDAVPLKLYTFGQPRTGDPSYATYMEDLLGEQNIHRSVHTTDGIPGFIFPSLGYAHFATEYWQYSDPIPFLLARERTIKKCVGGEDPACSAKLTTFALSSVHWTYYGQEISSDPTVCL